MARVPVASSALRDHLERQRKPARASWSGPSTIAFPSAISSAAGSSAATVTISVADDGDEQAMPVITAEHKNFILGVSSVWLLVPVILAFHDAREIWAVPILQVSIALACVVSTLMWRFYAPGSCLHTSDFVFAGLLFVLLLAYHAACPYVWPDTCRPLPTAAQVALPIVVVSFYVGADRFHEVPGALMYETWYVLQPASRRDRTCHPAHMHAHVPSTVPHAATPQWSAPTTICPHIHAAGATSSSVTWASGGPTSP